MSARRAVQKGRGVGAPAAVCVCACDLVACDNVNHREEPFAFIPLLGLARLTYPVLVAHVCVCVRVWWVAFFFFFSVVVQRCHFKSYWNCWTPTLATGLFSVNSSTRGAAFRSELIVNVLERISFLTSRLSRLPRARPPSRFSHTHPDLCSCLSESRFLLCGSIKIRYKPSKSGPFGRCPARTCTSVSEHCILVEERESVSRRQSLSLLCYVIWPTCSDLVYIFFE